MKKQLLYIFTVAAVICSACSKEQLEAEKFSTPINADELGYAHDGKVTFGINPFGYGRTKAMTETSDIKNIYVAVFDQTGYKLAEYVKAEPITTGKANDTNYQYTIELKISDKPRILHFIANGPSELRFGAEQEVIGELYTKYDAEDDEDGPYRDAYWQRIVLDKIAPRPESDDDTAGKAAYEAAVNKLNGVKLIRNYSKISVSAKEESKLALEGFWFVNAPDRGSVAPYNRNTGDFVSDYLSHTSIADVEGNGNGQANYQGFMLASTNYLTPVFEETEGNYHPVSNGSATGFVYEREKALVSPMYLILKGKYNNSTTSTYYKVALQDENGSFYAMLRNFNYLISIENVYSAGYATPQAALEGTASGDISVNVDYQDLPNISDGNARITVSATTLMIIGTVDEPATATLWYKYEPDITVHGDTGIHNDTDVQVEDQGKTLESTPHVVIEYEGTSGSTGDVVSSINVADTNDGGNRTLTINTTNVGNVRKTQTLTITGRNWDGARYATITRTVDLILRPALDLTLTTAPNTGSDGIGYVKAGTDKSVILNLGMETGLPSSMFPLVFKIEPTAKNVTPDNSKSSIQDLPVRTGTDANGRPTYWFEKIIQWDEYSKAVNDNGTKTFPVYFTTNATSATSADLLTTFKVSQEYFNPAEKPIKIYEAATFTPTLSGDHTVGETDIFSFTMSKGYKGDVTIAMKGYVPASDAGLTFKEVDENGNRIYTLAVNTTEAATFNFNVIPFMEGYASITLSAYLFDDNSVSVAILDPDTPALKIKEDELITVTSQKVYGDNLVPGMNATVTFYVKQNISGTVKLDRGDQTKNINANTDGTTADGFKEYTISYTAANNGNNSTGYNDVLVVYAGDAVIGSITIPVYGIEVGEPISGASQSVYNQTAGTGWYLIENQSHTNYHLYKNGNNIGGTNSAYDYSSIFGFNATGGSVKVYMPSSNGYISGTTDTMANNNTQNNGQQYTFKGTQFSYYRSYYNRTYYWRQSTNNGNVSMNYNNNNYNTFNVRPITFVAPE